MREVYLPETPRILCGRENPAIQVCLPKIFRDVGIPPAGELDAART